MSQNAKLDAALGECLLHATILDEAMASLESVRPFDAQAVKSISGAIRRVLDQIACRFIKLQDILGERVLPGLLEVAGEPMRETATFQEKLRRLERLGAIPSADSWRLLREIRNQIAHEYPDAPAIQAAMLETLRNGARTLIQFLDQSQDFKSRL